MQVFEEYGVTYAEAMRRQKKKLAAARKERAKMAKQIARERVIEELKTAPRKVFMTAHGPAYEVVVTREVGGSRHFTRVISRVTLPFVSVLGR